MSHFPSFKYMHGHSLGWNYTEAGCPWVGPFQNCVQQRRPPFKKNFTEKNGIYVKLLLAM